MVIVLLKPYVCHKWMQQSKTFGVIVIVLVKHQDVLTTHVIVLVIRLAAYHVQNVNAVNQIANHVHVYAMNHLNHARQVRLGDNSLERSAYVDV